MYADHLITPRPEMIKAGVAPEALLESTRLRTIKAAYETSDQTYDDRVEAAYATANLVRQTLRFEPHTPLHPPFSPEAIAETHRTNCHGHSIVASECLDAVGINHWISFANQHSFLLLEDESSHRVNLIDTAVKPLYIDITPAFGGTPLADQDNEYGAVNRLRGDIVLGRSHFPDKEQALAERPWMSFTVGRDYRFKGEAAVRQASTLVMRSYRPEQGRALLESYANFTHAVTRKDFSTAHQAFSTLDGVYPDIDRRNRLYGPTQLVRELAHAGNVAMALDDIRIVEESLWPTQDLVLRLWPADQRRRLGVLAGQADLLDDAIETYEAMIEERTWQKKSTAAVRGRLKKTQDQRKQLFTP